MLLVYDQDLRYIRVGGQGLKDSGLNRESLEGRTVGEVFTEEMAADVSSHYKKALAGVPSVGEIVFNGRTYLAFNLPVMDEMGHTYAGLTFTQDINERKANEAGLARANRSLRMLTECNQALVRVKNEKELLNDICRIITTFGNYKLAWVGLAGQGKTRTVHPVAKAGEAKGFMSQLEVSYGEDELGQGPAGKATRTGQVCIMSDLWADKEFEAWRDRAIRFNLRSGIGLPLSHRGKPIGVLAIYSDIPGAFAEEDEVALLTELAMDLSYGLSNIRQQARRTRSEQTSARRGKQLEQLALAAQKLNTVLELDTIMDRLITSAMDVVGATSGMAGKMVDDRMVYAKINRRGGIEPLDVVFRSGEGVTGHVMLTQQPYFTNHPETDPHVIPSLRKVIGYYNLAIVPVIDRNGRLLGCFWMQDKPGEGFDGACPG
jgi:GAF domain-containing protein